MGQWLLSNSMLILLFIHKWDQLHSVFWYFCSKILVAVIIVCIIEYISMFLYQNREVGAWECHLGLMRNWCTDKWYKNNKHWFVCSSTMSMGVLQKRFNECYGTETEILPYRRNFNHRAARDENFIKMTTFLFSVTHWNEYYFPP